MSTMRVNIITPEEVVYDDEAELIVVRTIDGDRGIMPNHQSMVTGVDIGQIKINQTNQEHQVAVSGGYMEVRPDEVTILVATAEFAEEIDVNRAEAAKERAEKRLNSNRDDINEKRAEIALRKALNRLKTTKGRNFE